MAANQGGPENQPYGPVHAGVHTTHPAPLTGVWPAQSVVPTLTDTIQEGHDQDVLMEYQGTARESVSTLTSK